MQDSSTSLPEVTLRYLYTPNLLDSAGAIAHIVSHLHAEGLCVDKDLLLEDALSRQAQSPTGMKGQIAIPHCRSQAVSKPIVVVLKLGTAVDFGGPDGPADVVFFIGVPSGGDKKHMKILSSLARAVVRTDLVEKIRQADSGDAVIQFVQDSLAFTKKSTATSTEAKGNSNIDSPTSSNPSSTPSSRPSSAPSSIPCSELSSTTPSALTRVVAVTSCPTGVAHTYMAADALAQAASSLDAVSLSVETQGVSENTSLSSEEINRADVAIIASAVGVDGEQRFAHLPVIRVDAREAVDNPDGVLRQAVAAAGSPPEQTSPRIGLTSLMTKSLMTGLSALIPVLMIVGLFIAAAIMGNRELVATVSNLQSATGGREQVSFVASLVAAGDSLPSSLLAIGLIGLIAAPAVLAMSVSSAIAPRVGAGPGLLLGLLAVYLGTGFVGALGAGLVAGLCARRLQLWKAPPAIKPAVPLVAIPGATLLIALVLYTVSPALRGIYGAILAALHSAPTVIIVLCAVVMGAVMNIDFGGRYNKIAFAVAVIGVTTAAPAALSIMAATMAAGMVAPIALGIKTKDREMVYSGLLFITEPVLGYVSSHPQSRWAMRAGGAAAAGLSTSLGAATWLPHGGIVAVIGMTTGVAGGVGWIGALMAGVAVTCAGLLGVGKK